MAENLIATLATVYERAQQRGAISSGDEAWLIDNLGRVIEALQAPTDEALANARADVTHTMAELARVTHGRDALAAEVTALTRDFLAAVEAHGAAEAERDEARADLAKVTILANQYADDRDFALAERDAARLAVSSLTVQLAGPVPSKSVQRRLAIMDPDQARAIEQIAAAHVKLDPFDDGD